MKYKCEKCGTEMLNQSKGPYIHYVCPKCGNAYATYDYTKDDPIKFDENTYFVKSVNNKTSTEVLKIVSKISGQNYVKCKELIDNNDVICSGKARDIINSLKELKEKNIQIEISPTFKYKI